MGMKIDLLDEALIWAMRIPELDGFIFCRTRREMEELYVLPSMSRYQEFYRYEAAYGRWEFDNESTIQFCCCPAGRGEVSGWFWNDVEDHAGSEMHLLMIHNPSAFTDRQIAYLKTRMRQPPGWLDLSDEYKDLIPGVIYGN